MRYLLGAAVAVALMIAGSASAAVVKPAGLTQAAADLGSLELVAKKGRGHAESFCVACPMPVPLMYKNCQGTSQSCMAANPLCYVANGVCMGAIPAAAKPAKAKKGGKAKKKGGKKK
jgi:hypothetical protein